MGWEPGGGHTASPEPDRTRGSDDVRGPGRGGTGIGHFRGHHGGVRAHREARSSFALAALASSASFSPATAPSPHRVVSFISVVGCGTLPSSGIQQNRHQEIESLTSAHRLS